MVVRIKQGLYYVMLRDDYLRELENIRGDCERDICVQNAILEYLALAESIRDRAYEDQRLPFLRGATTPPHPTHIAVHHIAIPDELIARIASAHGAYDIDRAINASIRLWLQARNVSELGP